jgi:hypothetical protein
MISHKIRPEHNMASRYLVKCYWANSGLCVFSGGGTRTWENVVCELDLSDGGVAHGGHANAKAGDALLR